MYTCGEGHVHMDANETLLHMNRHYNTGIRELADDNVTPDSVGLTKFAVTVAMADVMRRADLAGVPWTMVLHDLNLKMYNLVRHLQATGRVERHMIDQDLPVTMEERTNEEPTDNSEL